MKHLISAGMLAAGIAGAPVLLADEAAAREPHFVKESMITAKVRSKLAAKHLGTLAKIKVDTDARNVVWLSGDAPTQDAVDMAGTIARETEGVRSVHNDILVQP